MWGVCILVNMNVFSFILKIRGIFKKILNLFFIYKRIFDAFFFGIETDINNFCNFFLILIVWICFALVLFLHSLIVFFNMHWRLTGATNLPMLLQPVFLSFFSCDSWFLWKFLLIALISLAVWPIFFKTHVILILFGRKSFSNLSTLVAMFLHTVLTVLFWFPPNHLIQY